MQLRPVLIAAATIGATAPVVTAAQDYLYEAAKVEHYKQPPKLLYDDFGYGPTHHDRGTLLANPIKGRAPIVIDLPPHYAIRGSYRYSTRWLPYFLFRKGFAFGQLWRRNERGTDAAALAMHIARGIAEIVKRAEAAGYDGSHLILMGETWGGHIAALLATDPSYLESAGVDFGAVKAVLIFDGAGFDLPAEMASASAHRRRQLAALVGTEPGAAMRLSPIHNAATPNAPRSLFYVVEGDQESGAAAHAMAARLRSAGTAAEVIEVDRTIPRSPGTYIGNVQNPDNSRLLRFLEEATK